MCSPGFNLINSRHQTKLEEEIASHPLKSLESECRSGFRAEVLSFCSLLFAHQGRSIMQCTHCSVMECIWFSSLDQSSPHRVINNS